MPLPLYQPQTKPPKPTDPRVVTFGLIVGNRGFFPQHLAERGRTDMLAVLKAAGYKVVVLDAADSRHGAIESRDEAKACAALFRGKRQPFAYAVTAYEENRRIVLEGEGEKARSTDEVTFEPAGTGTRITYEANLRLKGAARVAEPLLKGVIAKMGRDALAGLKNVLDTA